MLKSQWLVVALGALLITGLYFLPRRVLNKGDETPTTESQASSGNREASAGDSHSDENTELLQNIEVYKTSLSIKDSVAYWEGIDSVISAYLNIQRFDSASKYALKRADNSNREEDKLIAADIAFSTMQFALNQEKAAKYGQQAKELYQKLNNEEIDPLEKEIKLALITITVENPMQGILKLREIAENNPDNRESWFQLGLFSMQTGQFDKALIRFEHLIENDKNDYEAKFYKALCFAELNREEEARTIMLSIRSQITDPVLKESIDSFLDK